MPLRQSGDDAAGLGQPQPRSDSATAVRQLTKPGQPPQQSRHRIKASMALKRIHGKNKRRKEGENGAFQDLAGINGMH